MTENNPVMTVEKNPVEKKPVNKQPVKPFKLIKTDAGLFEYARKIDATLTGEQIKFRGRMLSGMGRA